jgi:hypothetical protein
MEAPELHGLGAHRECIAGSEGLCCLSARPAQSNERSRPQILNSLHKSVNPEIRQMRFDRSKFGQSRFAGFAGRIL